VLRGPSAPFSALLERVLLRDARPGDTARAGPFLQVLEIDEDAEIPGSVIVHASTELLIPNREAWFVNELLSPGTVVPWGGDLDSAFEQESRTLARMLRKMRVRIVLDEE